MTPDDIEAAARRVYDVMPSYGDGNLYTKTWEDITESRRNSCRQIATTALNVEEKK